MLPVSVCCGLCNNRIRKFALKAQSSGCPSNLTFTAPACSGKAVISWTEPRDTFPARISIPKGRNLRNASLSFKGTFNGHAYYESDDQYLWHQAFEAATGAGAHLITIISEAENNFVLANLNQQYNHAWIGLYNTGLAGSFTWVTGEPMAFTNWIPGQPDNLYGLNNPLRIIFEPYVHINGWGDPALCRWNDNGAGVYARFLAEFDNRAHTYRQISGPANGSEQSPGGIQYVLRKNDHGNRCPGHVLLQHHGELQYAIGCGNR